MEHPTPTRILVVDDEETLSEALKFNLEAEGYMVDTAASAEEALTLDLAGYDLVLLDIMMGEISGVQLARLMRAKPATAHVPIIFCTARDSDDDMVSGLNLGADDYITKPYSVRNVVARVRSVLRRTAAWQQHHQPNHSSALTYRTLEVDSERKRCLIDGREVKIPRKEFEILALLMANPGHIFSRAELLQKIWPEDVVVLDRVVDVNVTRLRSKLGPYAKNIITRSGYGYIFSL